MADVSRHERINRTNRQPILALHSSVGRTEGKAAKRTDMADEGTLLVVEPMTATTWEPDLSPMAVDTTLEPGQDDGRSRDNDTDYARKAPVEETWNEHSNTGL